MLKVCFHLIVALVSGHGFTRAPAHLLFLFMFVTLLEWLQIIHVVKFRYVTAILLQIMIIFMYVTKYF